MKRALTVGINKYGHSSDLSGCVNDSRDIEAALTQRGFEVQTLLDTQATGAAIKNALNQLITPAVSGDCLVFHYSGHGTYVPDKNNDEQDSYDEAICPVDLWTNGVLTDDELYEIYNQHQPGVRLVILSDSCFSGTVSRFAPTPARKGVRKVRFLPPESFLSSPQINKLGRAVVKRVPRGFYGGLLFGGAQDTEYSYDAWFDDRPNGAFTYYALQALKKMGARSTYKAWYSGIRKFLPSAEYPQTPSLYGSSTMIRWNVLS